MSHMKSLKAPRTWHIARKENIFTTRPIPSGHPYTLSLPLQVIMRDMLHHVKTARELRKLRQHTDILVDGKKQMDMKRSVGLFDVLSIPKTKEGYRIMLDTQGRLGPIQIDAEECTMKICKVTGKHTLGGGRIQFSLHDGRTLIDGGESNSGKKFSVGDSVVLSLPEGKVARVLELKEGAYVYLIRGKYGGSHGTLKEIKREKIVYEDQNGSRIETLKEYAIVVGENESLVTLDYEPKQTK